MKKIFTFFLALVGLMCVWPASAQTLVFHLPDGAVSEVSMPCTFTFSSSGDKLIIDGTGNHIELQRDRILAMTYRPNRGDSNNDMKVDVADIATIISIIAGKEDGNDPEPGPTPDPDPTPAPDGVKAIDLGLPSGTKWANMNIGATAPNESGLYFAWGETVGHAADDGHSFDLASYKWMTADSISEWGINKYQVADNETRGIWYVYDWDLVDYRFVGDGKSTLDLLDDAARANWGGDWRMPTFKEFIELIANTTNEWITVGGVSGRRFKSKKQNTDGTYNSIFLPAAGALGSSGLSMPTCGCYWSSSLGPSEHGSTSTTHALHVDFDSDRVRSHFDHYGRWAGNNVRPVFGK